MGVLNNIDISSHITLGDTNAYVNVWLFVGIYNIDIKLTNWPASIISTVVEHIIQSEKKQPFWWPGIEDSIREEILKICINDIDNDIVNYVCHLFADGSLDRPRIFKEGEHHILNFCNINGEMVLGVTWGPKN